MCFRSDRCGLLRWYVSTTEPARALAKVPTLSGGAFSLRWHYVRSPWRDTDVSVLILDYWPLETIDSSLLTKTYVSFESLGKLLARDPLFANEHCDVRGLLCAARGKQDQQRRAGR